MSNNGTKGIYVAFLNQGEVRVELSYLGTQLTHQNKYNIFYSYPADKPIESNRNKIVKDFLSKPEYDYLLMIDGDIIPPLNILDLADHDKDIITPVLYTFRQIGGGQHGIVPLIMKKEEGNDNKYKVIDIGKEKGIMEVDASGSGCMLIARRVLEHKDMRYPFKNYYDEDGIRNFGLDFSFCKRAKEAGFSVWVDTRKECSHWTVLDLKMVYNTIMKFKEGQDNLVEKLKERLCVDCLEKIKDLI